MKLNELLLTNKNKKVIEGTIPYLEISDINIISKSYELKEKGSVSGAVFAHKNNVLVSTVRPSRGAITIVQEKKLAVSNAFAILNIDESISLPKYIFYALNNTEFLKYLEKNSKGATYPTCSKDNVFNYDIKHVQYLEQKLIVDILDRLSMIIRKKRKQLSEYDQLIKSRFVEMFDSFDKIDLYRISEIIMGQSPDSSYYNEVGNGTPFFQGKTDFGKKYTSVSYWTTKPSKTAKKGNVLMSVRAPVGPVNISSVDCCIGRGLCSINALPDKTNNEFLYNALIAIQDQITAMGTGSTFKAINKSDVYSIQLPLAPISLQNDFAKFVEQVDKLKFEVQKSLDETQQLFDSLMQEYFS